MKKIVSIVVVLTTVLGFALWCAPLATSAEHGGATVGEHGGATVAEHGGKEMTAESQADVLLEAASKLEATEPELAAKLRQIAADL